MNVANGHSLQRRAHRDLLAKKSLELQERNLGISISLNIPPLNSLVSDVTSALLPNPTSTSSQPAQSTQTTSSTTSSSPPSTSSSSGGDSSSGNSGTGSTGSDGSDSSSSSSPSSNSGSPSGNGSGQDASGQDSNPQSSNPQGSNPQGSNGQPVNNDGSSNATSTSSTNASSSTNSNTGNGSAKSGNSNSPVQNVVGNPASSGTQTSGTTSGGASTSTQVSTIFSNGTPIATQTSVITSGPNGTGGIDGGGDSPSGDNSQHGLSGGIIAAIVIALLIGILVLVVLVLRRRSNVRRRERRQRWWLGQRTTYDSDAWSGAHTNDATMGSGLSGVASARSSFATTFDHSVNLNVTLDFTNPAPPLPPMAEIRDAHGPGLLLHSQESSPVLVDLAESTEARRVSTYSNRSSSSGDSHGNTLLVDPFLGTNEEPPSPMFVRPFTPSETFSFPKPPKSLSRTVSTAASVMSSPSSPNPFADPPSLDIETIQRPFEPTLHDEIRVSVGERVRVSKIFDDGWALIEKFPMEEPGKGKSKQIQGLVPIDCLRSKDQDIPEFLSSKRVSLNAVRDCAPTV